MPSAEVKPTRFRFNRTRAFKRTRTVQFKCSRSRRTPEYRCIKVAHDRLRLLSNTGELDGSHHKPCVGFPRAKVDYAA
jgi:hypothetical protein